MYFYTKIKHLFDSKKKIASGLMLFIFSIFSQLDIMVLNLNIPNKEKLTEHNGKTYFSPYAPRIGSQFYQITENNKKIFFTCDVSGGSNVPCFSSNQEKELQGKNVKTLSYLYDSGISEEYLLLELEINGDIMISYSDQKNKYLKMKDNYPYIWIVLLIFTTILFIILQISNTPKTR
jgi:hypothetical protein